MITLRQVQLIDFLSHANTQIRFQPGDRILLDGTSGSGKSSVVDAIIWGLYGVARGENRSLVRAKQKAACVVLDLFDDTSAGMSFLRIQRKVTSSGKHSLELLSSLDGESWTAFGPTGVKESQIWLEHSLLHASYELFVNSVAYPQGNQESFVLASSSRRKELLLEIVNIEDISDYYERARTLVNVHEQEIAVLTGELVANARVYAEAKLNATKKVEYEKEAQRLEGDVRAYEEQYVALKADGESLETRLRTVTDLRNKRKTLVAKVSTITDAIKTAREELAKLEADQETTALEKRLGELVPLELEYKETQLEQQAAYLRQQKRQAVLAARPQDGGIDNIILSLQTRLTKTQASHPVCPSGDECPYMRQYTPEIESLKVELEEKKAAKVEFEKRVADWTAELDTHPVIDLTIYTTALNRLAPQMVELGGIRNELDRRSHITVLLDAKKQLITERENVLTETEAALNETDTALAGMDEQQLQTEMAKHKLELAPLADRLNRTRDSLVDARAQIKQAISATTTMVRIAERDATINKIIAAGREEARILSLLKLALGSNGIRAMAVDYILPILEEKINTILSQLSDFKIRLDTQRDGSGKGTTIEGLFITIKNGEGEEFPYENYSGGQRLRIIVAISEALASLQKVGFRLIDELFVGLDEDMTLNFVQVLAQIQSSFDQVLCISHLPAVKDSFEKKLIVRNVHGVSRIDSGTMEAIN